MKTVMIYDQCGEQELQFFIFEGDHSRLNKVYINTDSPSESEDEDYEKRKDELLLLLYKSEGLSEFSVPILKEFPVDAVKDGAIVIVAGFAP